MLADYGADVVWVEPPGGDPLRRCAPEAVSVLDRGKRSVELDLHDPAAREQVLALIDRAEVFVESWRPGVAGPARPRLRRAPRTQPRAGLRLDLRLRRGFRPSICPATSRSCRPCSAACPTRPRTATAPCTSGSPSPASARRRSRCIGALAALRRAREDGWGRHVETSLLDGALAYHSMLWGESDAVGRAAGRAATAAADRDHAPGDAFVRVRATASTSGCTPGRWVRSGGRCACSASTTASRRAPTAWTWACRSPTSSSRSSSSSWSTSSRPGRAPSGCSGSSTPTCARSSTCGRPRCSTRRRRVTTDGGHRRRSRARPGGAGGARDQVLARRRARYGGRRPTVGEHTDDVLVDRGRLACTPTRRRAAPVPDHPPAARRRAHPRPRRVLRGAVLVPPPGRPRRRRREGRAARRRPAARASSDRSSPRRPGSAPMAANLKDPALARVTEALLRRADVVHHNLRPGAAERLGLDDDVRTHREPGDRVPARAGVGIDGPVRDAPELRADAVRVRGRHLRDGGAVQPAPAAVGQRGPGQRDAGRDRDPARAAPPRSHRRRTGGREPAAERDDGAPRAHRAHARRRRCSAPGGSIRCRWASVRSIASTRPATVGSASSPRTSDERQTLLETMGVDRVDDDDTQVDRLRAAFAPCRRPRRRRRG